MKRSSFDGFQEENYLVTWGPSRLQLQRMYELGAEVFCRELGWVKSCRDSMEQDEFDPAAVHIVLFNERSYTLAAVRLVPCDAPWMIDTVFRNLASSVEVKKRRDTMEVSRLAVAKQSRHTRLKSGRRICDLLYKGTYKYCKQHAVRYLCMVTSSVVHRHPKCAGLPCEAVESPTRMEDGVNTLAAKLDWSHISQNAALFNWYESGCLVDSRRDPCDRISLESGILLSSRRKPRG